MKQRTYNSDILGEVILSELPAGNVEVLKKDTSGAEEEVRHPHWICDLDFGLDAPDSVIEKSYLWKTQNLYSGHVQRGRLCIHVFHP